jgi:tight adherence protein B
MDQPLIITISLVFLAALFAGFGIRSLFLDHRTKRIKRRIEETAVGEDPGLDPLLVRDTRLSAVPLLDRILQKFRFVHYVERLLLQADVTSLTVGTVVLLVLTLACLGAMFASYVIHRSLLGVPMGILFGVAPLLVLHRKKYLRLKRFEQQLPDALDLITGALRSGMALPGAMQLVAEESPDPVAKEFYIVFEEHRLGLDMAESLKKMTERVESREVRLFVTAVVLQRETGGNLAEILEGTADIIRDRFRILGDLRTITAQARLTGTILAILPIVMAAVIWWMSPDYLKALVEDPAGPYLIFVAVFLQVVGYFVIRKIIAIKV